jgi:hypothetical protein
MGTRLPGRVDDSRRVELAVPRRSLAAAYVHKSPRNSHRTLIFVQPDHDFFRPSTTRNNFSAQSFEYGQMKLPIGVPRCHDDRRVEARNRNTAMTTLKTLAIAAALVGSTSLAFAQGAGIGPNGNNLPPQTNTPGTTEARPADPSLAAPAKQSKRLYNMSTTSKKKHHATPSSQSQ